MLVSHDMLVSIGTLAGVSSLVLGTLVVLLVVSDRSDPELRYWENRDPESVPPHLRDW